MHCGIFARVNEFVSLCKAQETFRNGAAYRKTREVRWEESAALFPTFSCGSVDVHTKRLQEIDVLVPETADLILRNVPVLL